MRILYFESDSHAAESVGDVLTRSGIGPPPRVAANLGAFEAALRAESWDAVLSEYRDGVWRGHPALDLARRIRPAVPFILLSSASGGELAAACVGGGAADYVLKSRLWRLPLALRGAVDHAGNRAALTRAEAALQSSEAQALAILRTALDGIVTIGTDGKIRMANPAAERIFGYEPGELTGMPIAALTPEPHRSRHGEYIGHYLDTGVRKIMGSGREVQGLRKSGIPIPLEVAITEVEAAGEKLFTGIVRDIRQRKELEAQLLQAQKMEATGRVAAAVAHDFNNVLTVVSGQCQFLLGLDGIAPEVASGLHAMEDAVGRARDLIGQLLVFSRKSQFHPRSLDLNAQLRKSEGMLRLLLGTRVQMKLDLAPALPPIFADPVQIDQALMNLVANARDAMPQGGTLTIRTESKSVPEASGSAQVSSLIVSDTGMGMTAEVQARIFDPFFTTKPPGQGTGLGLSTVHGIVTRCHGQIEVDSTVGKGTQFRLHFPAARGAAVA